MLGICTKWISGRRDKAYELNIAVMYLLNTEELQTCDWGWDDTQCQYFISTNSWQTTNALYDLLKELL